MNTIPSPANALTNVPPLEQAIVRFIQELKYEDLDRPAHAGINRLMRDQLALQIGISRMPWSKQILRPSSARDAAASWPARSR